MSEYDMIRQKNIEERQRKYEELQLHEAKKRLNGNAGSKGTPGLSS